MVAHPRRSHHARTARDPPQEAGSARRVSAFADEPDRRQRADSGRNDESISVTANFIINRAKAGKFDTYVGRYDYDLVPRNSSFMIRRKRAVLAHDMLDPQGKISFII